MRLPLFFFIIYYFCASCKNYRFFLITNQYSGLGKYSNKAKQCPVHPFIKKRKKKEKTNKDFRRVFRQSVIITSSAATVRDLRLVIWQIKHHVIVCELQLCLKSSQLTFSVFRLTALPCQL